MASLNNTVVNGKLTATGAVVAPTFVGSLSGTADKATCDAGGNDISSTYVKKSGDTMTGALTTAGNLNTGKYALNLVNSDIIGVNGIYMADPANASDEGISWYRDGSNWDRLYSYEGTLYYLPNDPLASVSYDKGNTVWHSGNLPNAQYWPRGANGPAYSTVDTSYVGTVATGPLFGTWEHLIRSQHRNGFDDGPNYIFEISTSLWGGSDVYWRKRASTTSWDGCSYRKFLDTGNIADQLSGYAKTSDIPTKTSQLTNDSGYTTNAGTVTSVAVKMNGSTKGTVTSSGTIDLGTVLTSVSVSNSAPTLSWGGTSTIGTVAGTALTVKMPSNPNTNTITYFTGTTHTYVGSLSGSSVVWNPITWSGGTYGCVYTITGRTGGTTSWMCASTSNGASFANSTAEIVGGAFPYVSGAVASFKFLVPAGKTYSITYNGSWTYLRYVRQPLGA